MYSFREICSFSAEARRGAGHCTLLVWLSSREPFLFLPWDRDHRCRAVTPALVKLLTHSVRKSSSETPPLGSEAKGWLMRCTGCLLYSRCDQRQLDAMIACQCPLARLVTFEVDRSLSGEIPIRRSSDVTRSDRLKGNLTPCPNQTRHDNFPGTSHLCSHQTRHS